MTKQLNQLLAFGVVFICLLNGVQAAEQSSDTITGQTSVYNSVSVEIDAALSNINEGINNVCIGRINSNNNSKEGFKLIIESGNEGKLVKSLGDATNPYEVLPYQISLVEDSDAQSAETNDTLTNLDLAQGVEINYNTANYPSVDFRHSIYISADQKAIWDGEYSDTITLTIEKL